MIAFSYGNEKGNIHIMDYTFENYEEDQKQGVENVKKLLTDNGLEQDFPICLRCGSVILFRVQMMIMMYLICHPL